MADVDKITYDQNGVPIIQEGPQEHLQGVVSGKVQVKKKGRLGRYLAGLTPALIAIAAPTAKKFALEAFRTALHMDEPSSGYDSRSRELLARPSYRDYYDNDPAYPAYHKPDSYDYNDVIFYTRGDAERVLEQMRAILARQKVVRVSQLYDLCRIAGEYTDNYWGWASLFDARVVSTRDGRYKINLPPPMSIN